MERNWKKITTPCPVTSLRNSRILHPILQELQWLVLKSTWEYLDEKSYSFFVFDEVKL